MKIRHLVVQNSQMCFAKHLINFISINVFSLVFVTLYVANGLCSIKELVEEAFCNRPRTLIIFRARLVSLTYNHNSFLNNKALHSEAQDVKSWHQVFYWLIG